MSSTGTIRAALAGLPVRAGYEALLAELQPSHKARFMGRGPEPPCSVLRLEVLRSATREADDVISFALLRGRMRLNMHHAVRLVTMLTSHASPRIELVSANGDMWVPHLQHTGPSAPAPPVTIESALRSLPARAIYERLASAFEAARGPARADEEVRLATKHRTEFVGRWELFKSATRDGSVFRFSARDWGAGICMKGKAAVAFMEILSNPAYAAPTITLVDAGGGLCTPRLDDDGKETDTAHYARAVAQYPGRFAPAYAAAVAQCGPSAAYAAALRVVGK